MSKKNAELARIRQVEINKLYSKVRQEHPQAYKDEVLAMMNSYPAPRFYITRATAIAWIWQIEQVGNNRVNRLHKQAADYYKVFQRMWKETPHISTYEVAEKAIHQPAPSYYVTPFDLQKGL